MILSLIAEHLPSYLKEKNYASLLFKLVLALCCIIDIFIGGIFRRGYIITSKRIGMCYEKGNIVKQNITKAAKWYGKAAECNDKWAIMKLIGVFYSPHTQENEDEQDMLRLYYEDNLDVKEKQDDYTKKMNEYLKSAELGDLIAQNNLGWCYLLGYGVKEDYAKAIEWYQKAAEQGNANAQAILGRCYEYGILGIPKNQNKATEWYGKAIAQGNTQTQSIIDQRYESFSAM